MKDRLTVHIGDAVSFGCVFKGLEGECVATGGPCNPDEDCFIEASDTLPPEDDDAEA